MQVRRTLNVAHAVLNFVVLRLAWAALGAFVGVWIFIGLSEVVPETARWLDREQIEVGRGATLSLIPLVWLVFATAGAAGFTRVWSLVLARLKQRQLPNPQGPN